MALFILWRNCMKAWQITAKEEIALVEKKQEAEATDVKVRISEVALSSTDVAIFEGKKASYPIIPVRSAIGLVSEAHAMSGLKKGERVVLSPYVLDDPFYKKKGALVPDVKVMGLDMDGFLCDFISMPPENVYPLPEGIKDNDAIFTEQIALAVKSLGALETERGDYVAILGANTLGIIAAELCIYYQLVPIVIDVDETKLSLAENHGIYYTINPSKADVRQRIIEITGGKLAEFTLYEPRSNMLPNYIPSITQEGGTVAVIGYNYFLSNLQLNLGDVLEKQLNVTAVKNGYGEFNTAINLLANEVINTEGFIDSVIKFDDIDRELPRIPRTNTPTAKSSSTACDRRYQKRNRRIGGFFVCFSFYSFRRSAMMSTSPAPIIIITSPALAVSLIFFAAVTKSFTYSAGRTFSSMYLNKSKDVFPSDSFSRAG